MCNEAGISFEQDKTIVFTLSLEYRVQGLFIPLENNYQGYIRIPLVPDQNTVVIAKEIQKLLPVTKKKVILRYPQHMSISR
ncbi:hypothetical protein SK128_019506 [Halocaridina rubra]|uniref:Uncharacterized protein n=1 Tax=Halocaridina rubra TaxID=373956 RepID=A0AAN8X4E0_HALRR